MREGGEGSLERQKTEFEINCCSIVCRGQSLMQFRTKRTILKLLPRTLLFIRILVPHNLATGD